MKAKYWLGLVLALPLSASAELSLERLMRDLAAVEAVDAHFSEVKELAILDEPMRLTGILRYRAPDYMKKQVLLPFREVMEVQGQRVLLENPDERMELDLDDHPPLRAFVESLRSTLAGHLDALRRYYRVDLRGERDAWEMRLQPRERLLKEAIEAIIIRGSGSEVVGVETLEKGGDRSVMTIVPSNR